ncbi:hypothetical protein FW774_11865 [Pedobacter sp. BS3]|uniref:hypothetical protein n=1 Tax=Pedobacter sp. BS3 TaxID=2567937 RepID=UPI0011EFA52A|nr:hypothetical protein [Pedobacter sp. BS3]TZF82994.1 hypothetical protein FW774_11865 [Pedobacter sp. BS3]
MKKITSLSFIAVFAFLLVNKTQAQDYKHALGVRVGAYNGINFKTFLNAQNALDFNLNFRSHDDYKYVFITGLYEIHNNIQNAPGLRWYYGGGASLGSSKPKYADGSFFLSADGVLGLDYKFTGAPINLALDWRPRLQLVDDVDFWTGDVGLAIRFTF